MSDLDYIGLEANRHELLMERYSQFIERLSDVDKEPVKIYDPLPQRAIRELQLIREVSATLQDKKEAEMRRIEQAAKEAEETVIKETAEKVAADEAVK